MLALQAARHCSPQRGSASQRLSPGGRDAACGRRGRGSDQPTCSRHWSTMLITAPGGLAVPFVPSVVARPARVLEHLRRRDEDRRPEEGRSRLHVDRSGRRVLVARLHIHRCRLHIGRKALEADREGHVRSGLGDARAAPRAAVARAAATRNLGDLKKRFMTAPGVAMRSSCAPHHEPNLNETQAAITRSAARSRPVRRPAPSAPA